MYICRCLRYDGAQQLYVALSIMHQNGEVDCKRLASDVKSTKSQSQGNRLPSRQQAAELFTDKCVGYWILIRVSVLVNNQSNQQTVIRGKVRGGTDGHWSGVWLNVFLIRVRSNRTKGYWLDLFCIVVSDEMIHWIIYHIWIIIMANTFASLFVCLLVIMEKNAKLFGT